MMLKPKQSTCIECNQLRYIYSKKMCQHCYWKSKPKKQIQKAKKQIATFSKKRLNELKTYRLLRDQFMKDNPFCERCGLPSTDLHHKISRQYHLNDVGVFCSLCRSCHDWVHSNDLEARKQGYLLSKF